jgi:hypothetical protein
LDGERAKDHGFMRDNWEDFLKHKSIFYNISFEKGYDPKNAYHIAAKDSESFAEFSPLRLNKGEFIKWLIKELGIDHSRDFEAKIDRVDIEKLKDEVRSKAEDLYTIFNVRPSRGKGRGNEFRRTLDIINAVLDRWAGTKLVGTAKKGQAKTFKLKNEKKLPESLYLKIKPMENPKAYRSFLHPRNGGGE